MVLAEQDLGLGFKAGVEFWIWSFGFKGLWCFGFGVKGIGGRVNMNITGGKVWGLAVGCRSLERIESRALVPCFFVENGGRNQQKQPVGKIIL